MATKARKGKTRLWEVLVPFSPEERLRRLRQFRGILKGKGPKNVEAWQRKIRKDRKIV